MASGSPNRGAFAAGGHSFHPGSSREVPTPPTRANAAAGCALKHHATRPCRMVKSDAFKAAQEEYRAKVEASFVVHSTSPFDTNMVVYVLAWYTAELAEGEAVQIYSILTSQRAHLGASQPEDTGDELTALVGASITHNSLRDGVLAFASAETAER